VTINSKDCSLCGVNKPHKEFSLFPNKKHKPHCKSCHAGNSKEYYYRNKDIIKKNRKIAYDAGNKTLPNYCLPADKACSKCGSIKLLDEFSISSDRKFGRKSACKVCMSMGNKAYYQKNRESMLKKERDRYHDKSGNAKETKIKYLKNNLGSNNASSTRRYADKLNAVPRWADLSVIKGIYEYSRLKTLITKVKHHVDHIIPLQHKLVCGLHTEANLQVITATDNQRKSNRFIPGYQVDLNIYSPS